MENTNKIEDIFDSRKDNGEYLVFKLIGIFLLISVLPVFSKALEFVLRATSSQTTFNLIYFFIGAVVLCFICALLYLVGLKLIQELQGRKIIWQK